jgi:DNA-binding beta-propeller fold protein YncE
MSRLRPPILGRYAGNSTSREFPIFHVPGAIAFDGTHIWVTSSGGVSKLTSDGVSPGAIPVGVGPSGVAFDGAHIWVAKSGDNTVTKLRASDGMNLAPIRK